MPKPRATEQRNPRTRGIDCKSTIEILRAIHREDASVAKAVAAALPAITRAVDAIAGASFTSAREPAAASRLWTLRSFRPRLARRRAWSKQ